MENIELVIKIPEEHYNAVKNGQNEEPYGREFADAIVNGVPLPKGHGRLIDEDAISGDGSWDFADRLAETPTIIEAEAEENEDVLSKLDRSMECLLESDHRSFSNRETENGWIFDHIIEWRKMIKPYIKE